MKLFLFICNLSYSDELLVPFSCYPKDLQKRFAENGRKLDLNGNDRTPESWGFLFNKGAGYVIYTYRTATPKDLEIMLKVTTEASKWQNQQFQQ